MDFNELKRKELEAYYGLVAKSFQASASGDQNDFVKLPKMNKQHREYLRLSLDILRDGINSDDAERIFDGFLGFELFIGNKGIKVSGLNGGHKRYLRESRDILERGIETDDVEKVASGLACLEQFTLYRCPYGERGYDDARIELYGEGAEYLIKAREIRNSIPPVPIGWVFKTLRKIREGG